MSRFSTLIKRALIHQIIKIMTISQKIMTKVDISMTGTTLTRTEAGLVVNLIRYPQVMTELGGGPYANRGEQHPLATDVWLVNRS